MKIDFANLPKAYAEHKDAFDSVMSDMLENARYIMGPEISELECELAGFTKAKYALSVSSGTDALILALMAMNIGPGDEVITIPFTFIASAESIALVGATPVFIDVEKDSYNMDPTKIEAAITSKTKAIMPVSLFGQMADMEEIERIASKHGLKVIEDAAQSFGATRNGRRSCAAGDVGCTSFFPAKPLGCFGDGGAVFTNNESLFEMMRIKRIHGQTGRYIHKHIGIGGRLDNIQAGILLEKLKHYEHDIARRQQIAGWYTEMLDPSIQTPSLSEGNSSVWAQYTLRFPNRDEVQNLLSKEGIPTAVHYPSPLHFQECFSHLGYNKGDFPVSEEAAQEVLSLPMNPYITKEEATYICTTLNRLVANK